MANRGNFKLGKNGQMLKEESALGSLAKANSNALTTMNKIISLPELQLPKNWEKLHLDLDAACDIYEQLKRNGVKEHFTQVDSFKIYAILCVINYSLSKIHQNDLTSLYVYKLPLKELAQIVNCGKCGVSQTKEVKKQLVLITKLVRYEGKQIIFYQKNQRSSPYIHVYSEFFKYGKKFLNCKKHALLRLSSTCCSYLFKLNRKPKAFICMLEMLFQETKLILENSASGKSYDRTSISDQRLIRLFSPKAPHSVKEILKVGKSLIEETFGKNFSILLHDFARQMIEDSDVAKFALIKQSNNEAYQKKFRKSESLVACPYRGAGAKSTATNDASYNIA